MGFRKLNIAIIFYQIFLQVSNGFRNSYCAVFEYWSIGSYMEY